MEILSTFLTVVSIIWLILCVLSISATFYRFSQLTPVQQQTSTIDISRPTLIGAVLSGAWLITVVLV